MRLGRLVDAFHAKNAHATRAVIMTNALAMTT
jgi:hypothetical protein